MVGYTKMGTVVTAINSFNSCSILTDPCWTLPLDKRNEYIKTWGIEHFCPVHGIHVYLLKGEYVATAYSTGNAIRKAKNSADAVLKDVVVIRDRFDHEWQISCPKHRVMSLIYFLNNRVVLHYTLNRSGLNFKYVNHLIAMARLYQIRQDMLKNLYDRYFKIFEKTNYVLDEKGDALLVTGDKPDTFIPVYRPDVTAAQRIARRNMVNREYDFARNKINRAYRLAIADLRKQEKLH